MKKKIIYIKINKRHKDLPKKIQDRIRKLLATEKNFKIIFVNK